MSHISLVGNATADPEMRYTPSGKGNARFGLAVNRRWMGQNNEWQEATSFFNVVCWGDLAENVTDTVTKGMRVMVQGRLEQRSWETDAGEKRSTVEIVADEVGPSLRWATASVARIQRDGKGGGGGGGGASRARPPAQEYDVPDEEEPFAFPRRRRGDAPWI